MSNKTKYWVFVIERYYPSGGIEDLEAICDSLEEAERIVDHIKGKRTFYGEVSITEVHNNKPFGWGDFPSRLSEFLDK